MRRISMTTRDELVVAIAGRYAQGDRADRGRILDEFAAVTGFHRKHAMRLLRAGQAKPLSGPRPGRRVYDDAVREALIVVWEASDRVCGKRLRPLVPILVEAMERHGHLRLVQEVRISLLAMSAATIDRALRDVRRHAGRATRRRAAPSSAVRRSVPVRTFDGWDDPPPGFVEADLVAHSGPVAKGSFVQTLVLTDIATGWTECAPLLVREQRLLTEVLSELRKVLPFTLLGLDTDNDSVFMNETVRDYCEKAGVVFTRCRPYRKNDQAWVEQKNGAVVRRTVGYRRFEGLEAAAVLARLYAAMRLFVNFFQPSFKLAAKARDGAKVRKRYHPPATPCQRLLADARTSQEVRRRLDELRAILDPVRLLREVRAAQQQLVEIADTPAVGAYCLTGECYRTIDSLPHHSCSHCLSGRGLGIDLPFSFVTCLFAVAEPVELWATRQRRPSAAANPQGVAGQMRRRLQGQRRPSWSRIPFGVRLRVATPLYDAEVFLTVRPGRCQDTLSATARIIRAMCARALPRTTFAARS
jgi:hypothetical protein